MPLPKVIQKLIDDKKITAAEWKTIETDAKRTETDPEEILVQKGKITEEELATLKASLFGLPFINLSDVDVSTAVLTILPQAVAENHKIVVFEKKGNQVKVAMVDPGNYRALESIDFWAKKEQYKVEFYVTTPTGFRSALRNYSVSHEEVSQALETLQERKTVTKEESFAKGESLFQIIKKAPVAKIVSVMVKEAADAGASDIHIEPGDKETRIRFRVDGILKVYLKLPEYLHASLVSRIKVLAKLKIDETRVPQDGRIRMEVPNGMVDLRVSTVPVLGSNAEKVVMRILPTSNQIESLEVLGFEGGPLEAVKKIVERPVGVVLISGPTGSGKTTTLYSMLQSLNKEEVNIITLEDPVEYYVTGINQIQVNPDVGLTFASGLRAILRQDPNIVMVGEIRDNETAELAVHAALTGHFMLSTIHAKDVLGVIPRLVDMHVEPFLISSALNTIFSQRLVRRVCQNCKEETTIPPSLEKEMKAELKTVPTAKLPASAQKGKLVFYHGKGCDRCGNTGYKGRMVVAEVLSMTEELREIVRMGMSNDAMAKELVRQGNITLKQDAIVKALEGFTTVEEILRVTRE